MKKIYVAVVFVLISVCKINGQQYYPFPDSNAIWTVHAMACIGTCPPPPTINPYCIESNFAYFLQGDTLINSTNYHAIYQSGYHHEYCMYGGTVNNWFPINSVYVGAYRQDTALKKVFYVDPSGSPECLLYDFSLNIGDTLQGGCQNVWHSSAINDGCTVLTTIDSVLIGNNYRRRYLFSTAYYYPIIEGIGSIAGLLEPVCPFEYIGTLICFSQNGEPLYPDTITPCVIPNNINEYLDHSNQISISPNPTTNNFTITFPNTITKGVIEIYNVMGEKIFSEDVFNVSQKEVQLENMEAGIYFLELNTDGERRVRKILKQ